MLRIAFRQSRQSIYLIRRSTPLGATAVARAPRLGGIRFESDQSTARSKSEKDEKVQSLREVLQSDWTAPKVPYEEVKRRTMEPTEDAYLIDVREPDEVAQGSIPSSVSLPLSVLSGSFHLRGDEFLDKFGFMKPAYNQEIVFYCRSGKRSATACDVAKRNGYTNIKNYEGSWLDWVQREQPNTTS